MTENGIFLASWLMITAQCNHSWIFTRYTGGNPTPCLKLTIIGWYFLKGCSLELIQKWWIYNLKNKLTILMSLTNYGFNCITECPAVTYFLSLSHSFYLIYSLLKLALIWSLLFSFNPAGTVWLDRIQHSSIWSSSQIGKRRAWWWSRVSNKWFEREEEEKWTE